VQPARIRSDTDRQEGETQTSTCTSSSIRIQHSCFTFFSPSLFLVFLDLLYNGEERLCVGLSLSVYLYDVISDPKPLDSFFF
jgi:hypothetical protein